MKVFRQNEIRAARQYAQDHPDEVAVHLHYFVFPNSPTCFKRDRNLGLPIAHLFSQDLDLLVCLARRHGIKKIMPERVGTPSQHIDMCGKPLRELLEEMGENIEDYKCSPNK